MQKNQGTPVTDDNFLPYAVEWLYGGLYALIVGGFCAWWLVPFAYAERGYRAVGGEWMVVFVVSFSAFQIVKRILEKKYKVKSLTIMKEGG